MIRRVSKVLAVIVFSGLIPIQAQAPTEYQLKAQVICRFPNFVDWLSPERSDLNRPIVIGILGQDPFGREIDDVINGKIAHQRLLVIKRFSKLRDLTPCEILFICSSERTNLQPTFNAVAGSGALTVGETDRFAEAGGVIQLNMVGGKVRLVINQAAAERAGLKLDANLLTLAKVIRK